MGFTPKVLVVKDDGTKMFEGNLELVEGGVNKNEEPSFHVDVRAANLDCISIYMEFKDLKEFSEFNKELNSQINNSDFTSK